MATRKTTFRTGQQEKSADGRVLPGEDGELLIALRFAAYSERVLPCVPGLSKGDVDDEYFRDVAALPLPIELVMAPASLLLPPRFWRRDVPTLYGWARGHMDSVNSTPFYEVSDTEQRPGSNRLARRPVVGQIG